MAFRQSDGLGQFLDRGKIASLHSPSPTPCAAYHALPRLHEAIKHDLPSPNTGLWDAYREAIPAVLRQARDPDYAFRKPLPPTARPYQEAREHG